MRLSLRRTARRIPLLTLLIGSTGLAAPLGDWKPVREVEGVTVEARGTASGFNEHRGSAKVCTRLDVLEALVADTERFPEWLPYTRDAELLEASGDEVTYYVRSTTPWPLKDRDMVYRVTRGSDGGDGVHLELVGLPDHEPEHRGVTRMREARGEWWFSEAGDGLMIRYRLFVDPGPVPAFVANGRLASTVGQTLANLASRYPCSQI